MDDNCGEWVESMGVATGCGFKEIYRFPHTTYPYSSCICTFCSSIPTSFFILYIYTRNVLERSRHMHSNNYFEHLDSAIM